MEIAVTYFMIKKVTGSFEGAVTYFMTQKVTMSFVIGLT